MKIAPKQTDAFINKPDQACGILLYGPDRGLIRQRQDKVVTYFLEDLQDPFNRADLTEELLAEDPARLADELCAMSFTGGRRVVVIRDAAEKTAAALKDCEHLLTSDNAFLIIQAGDLTPRSALRKWAESHANAAALACYQDEGWSLESLISSTLRGYGLRANKDVLTWLTHNLGGDRMVILSELEKLSLYLGDAEEVALTDVLAVTDSTRERQLSELCEAVGDRRHGTAMRVYDRLCAEDVQAIAMIRSLSNWFTRLRSLRISADNGMSASQAVQSFRPPVFFRQKDAIIRQVNSWSVAQCDQMLRLMLHLEKDMKSRYSGLDICLPQAILMQANAPKQAA